MCHATPLNDIKRPSAMMWIGCNLRLGLPRVASRTLIECQPTPITATTTKANPEQNPINAQGAGSTEAAKALISPSPAVNAHFAHQGNPLIHSCIPPMLGRFAYSCQVPHIRPILGFARPLELRLSTPPCSAPPARCRRSTFRKRLTDRTSCLQIPQRGRSTLKKAHDRCPDDWAKVVWRLHVIHPPPNTQIQNPSTQASGYFQFGSR